MTYLKPQKKSTLPSRIAAALVLSLFLMKSLSGLAMAETLKLTTVNWQPFYGEDLPDKGFFSVLVRETFKRAGYQVEIEFLPWKRALEQAKQGNFDGLLGAYYNEERTNYFIYSDPVLQNQDVFITRNGIVTDYTNLEDLKKFNIGTLRAAAYSDELKLDGFNILEVNDDLQALRMLIKGRLDLVLMSETHYRYLLTHHTDLAENQTLLRVLDKPFRTYSLYCPIIKAREDSQEIINRFNKALSEMKIDGSREKILGRFEFMPNQS